MKTRDKNLLDDRTLVEVRTHTDGTGWTRVEHIPVSTALSLLLIELGYEIKGRDWQPKFRLEKEGAKK